MALIRKIAKAPKRSSRYRSQAHCNHVRLHACVVCDAAAPIEVAHVRLGSGAGMGEKPHDYLTVSLCRECHARQHREGERTFWQGRDVQAIMGEFIRTSPKRHEIEAHRNAS
jgi:hypothetical protein